MTDENKDLEITEENTRPDAAEEVSPEPGPFDATPDLLTHGSVDSTEAAVEAPGPVGAEEGQDPTAQPDEGNAENADGAGDVSGQTEGAPAPDQGTLNLPATGEGSSASPAAPGEPADMAGSPSAGKPIEVPVATVPTDAGYPVPKDDENEAPIHPATGEPMKGDGLGDDLGKKADDVSTPSTSSATSDAAPAAKADDDAEGNNVAELEDAVAKLNGRLEDAIAKLDGLAASIKKILHKL